MQEHDVHVKDGSVDHGDSKVDKDRNKQSYWTSLINFIIEVVQLKYLSVFVLYTA